MQLTKRHVKHHNANSQTFILGFLCLQLSSCTTGSYYFNGNEAFFRMQTAYENDVSYCRNNTPISPRGPMITRNERYEYSYSGSVRSFNGNDKSTAQFRGTGSISNNNESFGNNTAVIAGLIYDSINNNSECMSSLGWVRLNTKYYTPSDGNKKIAYNREFLKLVNDGYSEMRIAGDQTYLLNKYKSYRVMDKDYVVVLAALKNDPYNPSVDLCKFTIEDNKYNAECSAGNSSGDIKNGSVLSEYISIIQRIHK